MAHIGWFQRRGMRGNHGRIRMLRTGGMGLHPNP